jgi:hypothetical protein
MTLVQILMPRDMSVNASVISVNAINAPAF